MGRWMDGWMGVWMDQWVNGWVVEWMDGWMYGLDEQMKEWLSYRKRVF